MQKLLKTIVKTEVILSASLLICTILSGGFNWYNCIIPLLLLFFCVIKDRKIICGNKYCLFLVALMVLGFVSVITTLGDKQNAMYKYEQILCFVLPFFVGIGIKDEEKVLKSISLCAAATAVAGLLAYCKIINISDFVFNDRRILRLQSFLQYANTTAVLLGCGYFSLMKLYDMYHNRAISYFSSMVLIAFYLTVSKAAIPIFIVFGTFLILIEKKYARFFVLQNIVCMVFAAFIISAGFSKSSLIKILLISCSVALGGSVCSKALFQKLTEKMIITLWILGSLVFAITACFIFVSKDVSILETLFKRFDYMQDAVSLLKENWLTGIGPGAWRYYQYAVQTSSYNVADIHNGWLQILVEYGIIYFLIFFFMIGFAIFVLAKKKMYVFSAIMLFIGAHTLLDINLSFGIILMLLGLVAGFALNDTKEIKFKNVLTYAVLAISFVLICYMGCEYITRKSFENSYTKNKNEDALKYAILLEKICPYDSNLQISIAALEQKDAKKRIEHAINLSPMDPKLIQRDIEYSISQKNDGVLNKIEKFVKMTKYHENTYTSAKKYLQEAFRQGLCSTKEYDDCLNMIETQRKAYGIIDRNELLEEIVKQKKVE